MILVRSRPLPAWVPLKGGGLALALVLFLLIRLAEGAGVAPGWARSYLDDVICLPLVLGAVLVFQRLMTGNPRWCLPLSHGFLALVLFGCYFEFVLPRLRIEAVADPIDLVMYAAGLALFQYLVNRPGCGSGRPDRSSDRENDLRPCADHP